MINAIILITVSVFGCLLYYLISVRPRLAALRLGKVEPKIEKEAKAEKKERVEKDEIIAAIALALHMHSKELHEEEKTVLTLKSVAKIYSPWSSKIYGLRKSPR